MTNDRNAQPNTAANDVPQGESAPILYLRSVLAAKVIPLEGGHYAIRLGTGDLQAVHASQQLLSAQLVGAKRVARELAGVLGRDDLDDFGTLVVTHAPRRPSARAQLARTAEEGAAEVIARVQLVKQRGAR